MHSHYYEKDGFQNIRVEETADKFMKTLDSLVNYDDGHGRKYDILDSEFDSEHYQLDTII